MVILAVAVVIVIAVIAVAVVVPAVTLAVVATLLQSLFTLFYPPLSSLLAMVRQCGTVPPSS